jgi:hypothetical protein
MDGVIRHVEDIYLERGGVIFYRGGLADGLAGVRELEEELCGFHDVLDMGCMGRRRAASCGGELCCEEVCEEVMSQAISFRVKDIHGKGGGGVLCDGLNFWGPSQGE